MYNFIPVINAHIRAYADGCSEFNSFPFFPFKPAFPDFIFFRTSYRAAVAGRFFHLVLYLKHIRQNVDFIFRVALHRIVYGKMPVSHVDFHEKQSPVDPSQLGGKGFFAFLQPAFADSRKRIYISRFHFPRSIFHNNCFQLFGPHNASKAHTSRSVVLRNHYIGEPHQIFPRCSNTRDLTLVSMTFGQKIRRHVCAGSP